MSSLNIRSMWIRSNQMANYLMIILKLILVILNLVLIFPLSFALTSDQIFTIEIALIFLFISGNYVIAIIGVLTEHLITIVITNCITTLILFIELLKPYPTFVFYYFVVLMIFTMVYILTVIIIRTYYTVSHRRSTLVVVYRPPSSHRNGLSSPSMPPFEPTIDSLFLDENKSLPPSYPGDRPPLYEDVFPTAV